MRKVLLLTMLCMSVMLMAQPNYKYILQHMSEMSDREVLYRVQEYQSFHPREAHPYYLMGNILYRQYQTEHPLKEYSELQRDLYTARLYYGNCKHYLPEGSFKKELYPETAVAGKATEQTADMFLQRRIDSIATLQKRVETLYNAYCLLVNRYDSCLQDMTELSSRFAGEKQAQLGMDSVGLALLARLKQRALRLPTDIALYQKALKDYPIAGYQPIFVMRRVDIFRMDGLTTSDFLQSEVLLWDYAEWVDRFLKVQNSEVARLRNDIRLEHLRLQRAINDKAEVKPNNTLLNTIDKWDEASPMCLMLKLEYVASVAVALEKRILSADSLTADTWLMSLQLAYRLEQQRESATEIWSQMRDMQSVYRSPLYHTFTAEFIPTEEAELAMTIELNRRTRSAFLNVSQWLYEHVGEFPLELQISEHLMASFKNGALSFREL